MDAVGSLLNTITAAALAPFACLLQAFLAVRPDGRVLVDEQVLLAYLLSCPQSCAVTYTACPAATRLQLQYFLVPGAQLCNCPDCERAATVSHG